MEFFSHALDLIVHLDDHINNLVLDYGLWTYLILFLIIFCETGLVVTPFLPGDSLLFVLGALAASDSPLKLHWLITILSVAAVTGNIMNYFIGRLLAPRVIRGEKIKFLKQAHLDRTAQFFKKHGGKTIIMTRFIPIIRTFAPFMAGVGNMDYKKFMFYNLLGGISWIGACILAGFFFGNIPFVKDNFTAVIFAIIFISLIPAIYEFIHIKSMEKKQSSSSSK
jgi:membrane-associated protein